MHWLDWDPDEATPAIREISYPGEMLTCKVGRTLHVAPDYGRPHDIARSCWCRPRRRRFDGWSMYVHRGQN